MKVTISIKRIKYRGIAYLKDKEYDLPEAIAQKWVLAGHAKVVVPKVVAPKVEAEPIPEVKATPKPVVKPKGGVRK